MFQIEETLGLKEPNDASYIIDSSELTILWDWIKWQHLPYNKPELHKLVRQIGDAVDLHNSKQLP